MEKDFENLIEMLKKFEGVTIIDASLEPDTWVHFRCKSENTINEINSQVTEIQEHCACKLLSFPDKDNIEHLTYQIVIDDQNKLNALQNLSKRFLTIHETGSSKKAKAKELGIPDLSLVTVRQMAMELKQRQNLCFALIWMEESDRENIAIEGSGEPTRLVGLLARGLNMAVDWADRNIKFHRPKEE